MTVGELKSELDRFDEDSEVIVKTLGIIKDESYDISNINWDYNEFNFHNAITVQIICE